MPDDTLSRQRRSGVLSTGGSVRALLVALVAGLVGYLGNQAVHDSQVAREERVERQDSIGLVRAYVEPLEGASAFLEGAELMHRWPTQAGAGFFHLPTFEQRRAIQSRLARRAAAALQGADAALIAVKEIEATHAGLRVRPRDQRSIAVYAQALGGGESALAELESGA